MELKFRNIKILVLRIGILSISLLFFFLSIEIILRLRYTNKDTFVPAVVNYYTYTNNGLRVNRSKGSVKGYWRGHAFTYNFFAPHLRDTSLTQQGIRILTVGDSFVFGALLNKDETLIYRLQEYADKEFGENKFCFLNAASCGWGVADYVAFVEDFVKDIKPKIILVIMNSFDIERAVTRDLFNFNPGFGLTRKNNKDILFFIKRFFIDLMPYYDYWLRNSFFLQLLRTKVSIFIQSKKENEAYRKRDIFKKTLPVSLSDESRSFCDYDIVLTKELFIRLKKICVREGIDLYVTTTGYIFTEKYNACTQVFITDIAGDFFRSMNVPFYDISPYNKITEANKMYYRFLPEGHLNAKGAELMALDIWHYFLRKQLTDYLLKEKL
ncbi:MAG: hypothetical protein NC826_03335 [Candidatus Omnitrophica bacterium]|nr:hypothetical protein [Candidatus Omnitrophota bacterium]